MPTDSKDSKPASSPTPKKRREGTKRDLFIGLSYVLILLGLLGYGGFSLCRWKATLDDAPPLNCFDPVWSTDGENLAFLQTQPDMVLTGNDNKCSLWTIDRRADNSQLIVKDLENTYRLVGWFDNNDTILMQNCMDDKLTLMTVALKNRQLNKYSFSDATINIVGRSDKEIFLQRQLHNTKTNADEIELLTWSPQNPTLVKIIAIPNRPGTDVAIDSVTPNADARMLALTLRHTPKQATQPAPAARPALPPGVQSQDDNANDLSDETLESVGNAQYSVWVLNRYAKTLAWTHISSMDPNTVRTAWSKDSAWIASTANYNGYSDVAIYEAGKALRSVRLRTYAQEGSLTPQLRSSKAEVYLISNQRILSYNFDDNANSVVASNTDFRLKPTSITLSAVNDTMAITAPLSTSTQLYIGTLNNLVPERINLTGKNAPPTVLYEVATALQCALKAWN